MNNVDVIQEALWSLEGVFPGDYRLAALDALVARIRELEVEIERLGQQMYYECVPKGEANKRIAEEQEISLGWAREANARAEAAEARVTELEAAITEYLSDDSVAGRPIGPQWYIDCNESTKGKHYPGKARLARALAAPTKEDA